MMARPASGDDGDRDVVGVYATREAAQRGRELLRRLGWTSFYSYEMEVQE